MAFNFPSQTRIFARKFPLILGSRSAAKPLFSSSDRRFAATKIMRTYGRYLKDLFIASYSFPPRSFVRATTKYTIHKMDGSFCFDKAPNQRPKRPISAAPRLVPSSPRPLPASPSLRPHTCWKKFLNRDPRTRVTPKSCDMTNRGGGGGGGG